MKRKLTLMLLFAVGGLMTAISAHSKHREKLMYLGVLNGQVQGNSVVKVIRTLPEPVLFRTEAGDDLPGRLVIRHATFRQAPDGAAWVTVKQSLPESGREAMITLKTELHVDGKRTPGNFTIRGEDVVIPVPTAIEWVELKSNAPVELQVPANYKGNIQIVMQVEGEQTE